MKTTRQVLEGAQELIAAGWCRNWFHIRRNGKDSYCLVGALAEVTRDDSWTGASNLIRSVIGRDDLTAFNDTAKSKQVVLKALAQAIAACG